MHTKTLNLLYNSVYQQFCLLVNKHPNADNIEKKHTNAVFVVGVYLLYSGLTLDENFLLQPVGLFKSF
jgi:uncharacterized membrane protein